MPKKNERLILLRSQSKLTQQELADKLKVTKSAISMYENGLRQPKFNVLKEICELFKVDMDYLMGYSNIKRSNTYTNISYDKYENVSMIPLYSSISAGYGRLDTDFVDFIPAIVRGDEKTYFAFKVKGDSMFPRIPNNSTIVIKQNVLIENNEIGAFRLNGENFVKQKKIGNGKLILHSLNDNYDDMIVNEYDEFVEYGKVVKVIIDL
ncbi:helix-turn-helix domain-containing protein [Caviibacter abscessus]|uniref:helix-turn-helix domain-containing protein n=1 Tax=Caviibacter abscessus TaxID=1766719 RepID=UPI000831D51B|nr:XRE family transcriptional regulator [Caviibacter abscessus]